MMARLDMKPAFVIEQYDDVTGACLGCLAGPFETLDEARLEYGSDKHSFISFVGEDGTSTKVMQYDSDKMGWIALGDNGKPLAKPAIARTPGAFDPETYVEAASELAEKFPLSESPTMPNGSHKPIAVIIGDYPELDDGEILYNGKQGQVLKAALLEARLGPARAYLTTLTKHRLLDEKEKLDYNGLRQFVPILMQEIIALKPKVVFLLGLPVAKAVLGMEKLAQNDAIRTRYGVRALPNTVFKVVYHPGYVIHAGGVDTRTFDAYVKQFSPVSS